MKRIELDNDGNRFRDVVIGLAVIEVNIGFRFVLVLVVRRSADRVRAVVAVAKVANPRHYVEVLVQV